MFGPVQHEQVREARHRHAQVGVCAVAPTLVQCGAVLPHHLDLAQIVRRGVSRCADHHVDVEFAAVLGDQRPGPQGSRRAGDDLDVGPGERGNEVRGEHQPLAAQRGVGRQPVAQFGVGNGVLEHRRRHGAELPASCRCRARSPRCWTHCAATAGSGGTSWRTGRARRSTAPFRCMAGPASAGSRSANAGSSRPCLPPWPPPAAVARQSIRCRAPRRSCRSGRREWSQRAVCMTVPPNGSSSSRVGMVGDVKSPTADTTKSKVCSAPVDVVSRHVRDSASHVADTTSVLQPQVRAEAVPLRAALEVRQDLGLPRPQPRPVAFRSNEYEYRWDFTSQARPG